MNLHGIIFTLQLIPVIPTELFPTAPIIPDTCVPCESKSYASGISQAVALNSPFS